MNCVRFSSATDLCTNLRVNPLRLAIALDSTALLLKHAEHFDDQKDMVVKILQKLDSHIQAENVAVSLFGSENATLEIDFGTQTDLVKLDEAIKKLKNFNSTKPGFDIELLFSIQYKIMPNIFMMIKYQKDDTVYNETDVITGRLAGVPKIAVQVGVVNADDYWYKYGFKDSPFVGRGFDNDGNLDQVAKSICQNAREPVRNGSIVTSDSHSAEMVTSSSIISKTTRLVAIPTTPHTYHNNHSTRLPSTTYTYHNNHTTRLPSTTYAYHSNHSTRLPSTTYIHHSSKTTSVTSTVSSSYSSHNPPKTMTDVHPIDITPTTLTVQLTSVGGKEPTSLSEQLKREYHKVLNYEAITIDSTNESAVKGFIESSAKLLQNSDHLQEALQSETNSSGLNVLYALEKYCLHVAEDMANRSDVRRLKITSPNIDVDIMSVAIATFDGFNSGSLVSHAGSIHMPRDVFTKSNNQRFGRIVSMILQPFTAFKDAKQIDSKDEGNTTLASKIISVMISPPALHYLVHPVIITVKHNQIQDGRLNEPTCVFWKPSRNGWSTEGCHVSNSNETVTECRCNHMTHYAVLMSIGNTPTPEKHRKVLSVISYIGCTMSIIGVFLTLVTFVSLPVLRSERTRIHCNLSIAVGCSQILFLAAGTKELVSHKVACKVYAALMFYCFMSVFTWMLVEGIHLYQMIIIAFINRSMMKFYYIIGWGLSLCIVVIASSISHERYGTPNFCWISLTDGTIWAFTGPAVFVILINMMVLIAVLRLRSRLEKTSSIGNQVKTGARVSIVLLPLLGLTWVFGLFTALEESVVFQYIFAITNSLQGVLIFAFHCVGNSEVRREFQRKTSHWNLMRTLSSTSSMVTPAANHKVEPLPVSLDDLNTVDKSN